MVDISIIMPIYNAEKFLNRSVDSILNQSYKNWELILVNDGSIDGTLRICNNYANKDDRIKVINKNNEGVAMARQAGIIVAQGKYSIHCDADDWMEPYMLETMYHSALKNNADIVISDYYINTDTYQIIKRQQPSGLNCNDILLDIFNNKLLGSLWNKLIRTDLYRIYNAKFFEGINHCEDLLILVQLLQNNNLIITYYPEAFYHYYTNNNSITNNFTRDTYEMRLKFKEHLQNILKIENSDEICQNVSFSIFSEALVYRILSPQEIKIGIKIYKGQIKKIKSIRWKIGFYFLSIGLYNIAYKFIHY